MKEDTLVGRVLEAKGISNFLFVQVLIHIGYVIFEEDNVRNNKPMLVLVFVGSTEAVAEDI